MGAVGQNEEGGGMKWLSATSNEVSAMCGGCGVWVIRFGRAGEVFISLRWCGF
jgi:hypothetical protein